ncbi:hypothetical protein FACS1894180_4500 [Bacteroidia bacterium]|nr:hypothetical protein FACS1894180_4500 [Bacteroidia bacterium]
MNTDLSNQPALFRFVSLRSPELTKKENQNKRFVFCPGEASGVFGQAVAKRNGKTKWDVMFNAAGTFSAFKSEKDVERINPKLFELADWISRNKSTLDLQELAAKLKQLDILDKDTEQKLWDNLFYQVLTQKDFYVKESVMQMLVLQNILNNKDVFAKETFDAETAKQLLTARVVLPLSLFDELALEQYVEIKDGEDDGSVPQVLMRAQEREEARIAAENIEQILSELEEVEADHNEGYNAWYSSKLAQFQVENAGKIKEVETLQKQYKAAQRTISASYKGVAYDHNELCNQPDMDYPAMPAFTAQYPKEPAMLTVQSKLSANARTVLASQVGSLDSVKSFTSLKQTLKTNLKNAHLQVVDRTQFADSVLVFGDSAINLGQFVPAADLFKFQICNSRLVKDSSCMYMTVQVPAGYSVQQLAYSLQYSDKTPLPVADTTFTQVRNGNVLTLSNMFGKTPITGTNVKSIAGTVIFTNGQKYTFDVKFFSLTGTYSGRLIKSDNIQSTSEDDFKPNTFGYRRLGIADYQKVVSKICKYEVGEVAHIENVMARELREKVTTRFQQRQVIETESNEIETEKMTDVSSAERFEMQTEIAKMMHEDRQFAAHTEVNAQWGTVSVNAGASFASNVSKETSNQQAVNQAREITQRASERIVSRIKNEKSVKTTEEFTEENRHVFDNTGGSEHISGVYRFINAIYKNQIYNYGKRLMYEFMVPQPGKLHRLGMAVSEDANTVKLEKPQDPRTNGYADFTTIDQYNYQVLAAQYNASVDEYPLETVSVNKTFAGTKASTDVEEMHEGTFDNIELPDGYITKNAALKFFCRWDGDKEQQHAVGISFGDVNLYVDTNLYGNVQKNSLTESDLKGNQPIYSLANYRKKLSLSYSILNYTAFTIAFSVNLELDEERKAQWQRETFEKIVAGYNAQLDAYNQSLAASKAGGVQILDSNPLFYRQIEQTVLRQNCLSYLMNYKNPGSFKNFGHKMYENDTLTDFKVKLDKKMDDYGSFVKFMEQAFEWDLMSYTFYPYYWANKNEWAELYKFDSNDATFRSFMQAGMARVIVTVRPGFEKAVMHYMATGQIWNDGDVPVIGNPLYLSIVDELKEPEYEVEGTWNTVLPTNLIALQKSGVAIDAEGLPDLEEDEAEASPQFASNKAVLGSEGTAEDRLAERVKKLESRAIENIDIADGMIKLTTKGNNRQSVAAISVEALKRELEK